MVEAAGYLTSGIIEMGPHRASMQDASAKIVRARDGFILKRVARPPGEVSLRKDKLGYPENDHRFKESIEWLRYLGVGSMRLVVDGVTGRKEAREKNLGGYAAKAAVDGFAPLFLGRGVNYKQFYDEVRQVFDYAGFVRHSMQRLSKTVREKGRGGKAVGVFALETRQGVYVSFVGDPVVEWMSNKGDYRIIGTPDNILWQDIMAGKLGKEPPGFGSLAGKVEAVKRRLQKEPEHLHYWDVWEEFKQSPLASQVKQTLGQRTRLDLRRHVFFVPRRRQYPAVLGLGTDGIQKVIPARERRRLLMRARDPKGFVTALRKRVAGRYQYASDNLAYRIIPL